LREIDQSSNRIILSLYFLIGFFQAFFVNVILIPEFFRSASLFVKTGFVFVVLCPVIAVAGLRLRFFRKEVRKYGIDFFQLGRIYLLAASAASLLMAIWHFGQFLFDYLAVVEETKIPGIYLYISPIVTYNILKSILLAGLFSFLERFLKFLEDRKLRK